MFFCINSKYTDVAKKWLFIFVKYFKICISKSFMRPRFFFTTLKVWYFECPTFKSLPFGQQGFSHQFFLDALLNIRMKKCRGVIFVKGLERQCLIWSAVAGFNHARTITKASAKGLDTRQDYFNKWICLLGSLVNNTVR